jgi:hypothetical protein
LHLDRHYAGKQSCGCGSVYFLLCAMRRVGLHDTEFANATCGTIRLKLLKIGALVRVSVRRVKIARASSSRRRGLVCRCRPSQRRGRRPRLTRLTGGAATRNKGGIIPSSPETISSVPVAPAKGPASLASSGATGQPAGRKIKQIVAQTCSIVKR